MKVGDILVSNRGKGCAFARVMKMTDEHISISLLTGRRLRLQLSRRFAEGPGCGWVVKPQATIEQLRAFCRALGAGGCG